MSQSWKHNKRIVSKSQYVKMQGKLLGLRSAGVGLLLVAFWGALCSLASLVLVTVFPSARLLGLPLFLLFGTISFFSGKWGLASFQHADSIDTGILLTRSVADTLPAEESLVRASEEPAQEQQAILLRAATTSHETPSEQLVRPAREREP